MISSFPRTFCSRFFHISLVIDRSVLVKNSFSFNNRLNFSQSCICPNESKIEKSALNLQEPNEYKLDSSFVEKMIEKHPQLHFVQTKSWKNITEVLVCNGFKPVEVKDIIECTPKILELNSTFIQNIIQNLRNLEFTEKNILSLLYESPSIFLLEPQKLLSRYSELDKCFPHKEVRQIILKCPQVLCEDWANIMNKINYIVFTMGLDQNDIVKANALKNSLEYIRLRHQVIERTGFYKKPNPKTKDLSKNMALSDILNKNDLYIITYCGISLEEYNILANMLEYEDDEEYESDFEYDSD